MRTFVSGVELPRVPPVAGHRAQRVAPPSAWSRIEPNTLGESNAGRSTSRSSRWCRQRDRVEVNHEAVLGDREVVAIVLAGTTSLIAAVELALDGVDLAQPAPWRSSLGELGEAKAAMISAARRARSRRRAGTARDVVVLDGLVGGRCARRGADPGTLHAATATPAPVARRRPRALGAPSSTARRRARDVGVSTGSVELVPRSIGRGRPPQRLQHDRLEREPAWSKAQAIFIASSRLVLRSAPPPLFLRGDGRRPTRPPAGRGGASRIFAAPPPGTVWCARCAGPARAGGRRRARRRRRSRPRPGRRC